MIQVKEFVTSKTGMTFLALFITMLLGIAVGTLVSDRVLSAEQNDGVALLKVTSGGASPVRGEARSLSAGFAQVAKSVEPAVVNISTTAIVRGRAPQQKQEAPDENLRDFFGDDFWERFFGPGVPRERKATSLGSGVIVDGEGYILTNYHVVVPLTARDGSRKPADKIEVTVSSGETYVARVLGEDPESDLAVLKVEVTKPLPFARIGDTTKMEVGDWVLAIGNPFGIGQTVTSGIVSATGRVVPSSDSFGDYIQTDAAINPGNSGGPLVNMQGEIVGINTFIFTRSGGSQGVGFSIPSTVFVNSYNQIVTKGKIARGWLGVSMNTYDPMTPEMAKFFGVTGEDSKGIKDGDGVLITQLVNEKGDPAETGPAFEAGIRAEDVIVQIGSREIESISDLRASVANTGPGERTPIIVVRRGEVMEFDVTLAERTIGRQRPEDEGLSFEEREEREREKEIGLEFETLSAGDADRMGLDRGVRIRDVSPGSLADEAGLRPNQVITHVNGQSVTTAQDLYDRITSMGSDAGIVLRVVWQSSQEGRLNIVYTSFVKP